MQDLFLYTLYMINETGVICEMMQGGPFDWLHQNVAKYHDNIRCP